jgi:cardiolipin synthase
VRGARRLLIQGDACPIRHPYGQRESLSSRVHRHHRPLQRRARASIVMEDSTVGMILLGFALGVIVAVVVANFLHAERHIDYAVTSDYDTDEPQFVRSMSSLLGSPLLEGNAITPLVNGDEIFPAMLRAIRSAERTITFETFIYWKGDIGREFAEALAERARAGVRVLVLLDFVGTNKMDPELLDLIRDAGGEIFKYHRPSWYQLTRLNNRTHRKLLVVDGRLGFTGGVGIADEWTGQAQDRHHWRDSHFQIEGPVVAQVQVAFMANWIKTRSQVEHSGDFFPALESCGPHRAQMFFSSPQEGSETVRMMYLLSIAAARRRILLQQAYFVPDALSLDMLEQAARRGVRIEIIVAGRRTDAPLVRKASRSLWGRLLQAGVRIHEFHPTNYHCKVMITDGIWSSVGSTNFDNRSFRLNDEANLNIHDRDFAQRLEEQFEQDRLRSRDVTLHEWRQRPWREKLWERLVVPFRGQM